MNFLGIGSIIESVGKVADDLFTSDEERLKANLEEQKVALESKKVDASLMIGQMEINKEEGKQQGIFVKWRPFIGWVCGLGLAYQFLLRPILLWIWVLLQAKDVVPKELEPPPSLDVGQIMALVTGMLGMGGWRSFDKFKGTQTDKIK